VFYLTAKDELTAGTKSWRRNANGAGYRPDGGVGSDAVEGLDSVQRAASAASRSSDSYLNLQSNPSQENCWKTSLESRRPWAVRRTVFASEVSRPSSTEASDGGHGLRDGVVAKLAAKRGREVDAGVHGGGSRRQPTAFLQAGGLGRARRVSKGAGAVEKFGEIVTD